MLELVEVRKQETFAFECDGRAWAWDATAAMELVAARPPKAKPADNIDGWVEIAPLVAAYLGHDGKGGTGGVMEVDVARCRTEAVDFAIPLIAVIFPPSGMALVIDGWHRIYKAYLCGVTALPVHLLTREEERAVRLMGMHRVK